MTDAELIDWLSERSYVNATDAGNEDPRQFHYHAYMDQHTFREALSAHIRREPRKPVETWTVDLDDIRRVL